MPKIEIRCDGAERIPFELFKAFQGDLKSLEFHNYTKLKNQIIEHGFCEAVTAWNSPEGVLIANGHQRLRTLFQMEKEGYLIPALPVTWVYPKDKKDFAKIVLSLASQYGKVEEQGLYEYCHENDIPLSHVDKIRLPEIEIPKFKASYVDSLEVKLFKRPHLCRNCGKKCGEDE